MENGNEKMKHFTPQPQDPMHIHTLTINRYLSHSINFYPYFDWNFWWWAQNYYTHLLSGTFARFSELGFFELKLKFCRNKFTDFVFILPSKPWFQADIQWTSSHNILISILSIEIINRSIWYRYSITFSVCWNWQNSLISLPIDKLSISDIRLFNIYYNLLTYLFRCWYIYICINK